MRFSTILTAAALATIGAALAADRDAAPAVEKWSDSRLKVVAGLEVWLDAAAQNAARKALGKDPLATDRPLDIWYDGSGRGRHVAQKQRGSRPVYVEADGHAVVRFDGQDDHLQLADLASEYRELTIVVAAAPFSNAGQFRALLAMNRTGVNDYLSGLTLDQGAWPSPRFEVLNPEGAGFVGAVDVMTGALEFGTLQRIAVTSAPGPGLTRLYLNGKRSGQRDRVDSTIRMDQLTVGARFYTNGGPPVTRGFLEGAITEVLVYRRVLSADELAAVDRYLASKHGEARKLPMPRRPGVGKPLVTVTNPPPVQMLVPGFAARQLPGELTNINNVRYRPDGKLVALGYDGDVWLLSDTDGDGLEDKAEPFWKNDGRRGGLLRGPIGMALTPHGYSHGNGLFIASKGKCSLIVDTDGDDKADKETIVASGWKELPVSVDALGVAFDPRDGSVYFGLGTTDYTNAYQVDGGGQARYSLTSERGTILRVSPDFKRREIVCTGIRFPVGLALNADGELFCTDQEGATWLANGNPFDELLYIQRGRHYGFPPRHPRHLPLPSVVDEPSLFDYAPQHQSACGLQFNEPVNGGLTFGPAAWRGDALVCGYSRGKLYRTKLAKIELAGTPGYVAQNHLLASLDMLMADACVSPQGDLVVSVHSGGPDWGSGPSGKGRLYKIRYADKSAQQPAAIWPAGPQEVHVAFDRPLDPEHLRDVAAKIVIEHGRYVSPGDRFEVLRPGYQVVQDQLNAPRFGLGVHGLQLTADRRTLIIATADHPEATRYAVTLPSVRTPSPLRGEGRGEGQSLRQVPEIDLGYDLSGVEAVWQGRSGDTWSGWLPHLDLAVAREFTAGSAAHEELWARLRQPGRLRLRTKANLWQMLRPAVQPGSRIDHEWPAEEITLTVASHSDLQLAHAGRTASVQADKSGRRTASITVQSKADTFELLELTLATAEAAAVPTLALTWHTKEDARPRAMPLHRLLLPWAPTRRDEAPSVAARKVPELEGGNWARGRRVFFSQEAGCAKCHLVGGQGGRIGPNLSNLPHRDYHSVLRDITLPSYALNPDYVTSNVLLTDGRTLTGVLRTSGERIEIGDKDGRVTTVRREEIERLQPSALSIMPEGIPKQLGPERLRDLLTFLLANPPRMPDYGPQRPPPSRSMKEVERVLAGAPLPPGKTRPIRVVLVAGRKDHGPGEHDYPAWLTVWGRLLALADETKVTAANDWPSQDDLKQADVLVFYQQGSWTPQRAKDIDAYLARGGGLVYIHYAVDGGADAPGFAQRIGLAWRGGQSRFRHGPLELDFAPGSGHAIARNFDKVHFHDESYWQLVGDTGRVRLLAGGMEDGRSQPLFWALDDPLAKGTSNKDDAAGKKATADKRVRPAKGRVFVSIPGHFSWTFDDPLFRLLLLRGIAWSAHEPVDRFNDIVTAGARLGE
jgi:putative heme-binding domain-containing protein